MSDTEPDDTVLDGAVTDPYDADRYKGLNNDRT